MAMPAFSALAAQGGSDTRAVRLDFTQSIDTVAVTTNFFTTLGRPAIAGRVFTEDDARGSNAVVIGSRGWRRYFDSRPDLVGKTLFINNEPHRGRHRGDRRHEGRRRAVRAHRRACGERTACTDERTFYRDRKARARRHARAHDTGEAVLDRAGRPTARAPAAHGWRTSAVYRARDGRPPLFLGASVLVLVLTIVQPRSGAVTRAASDCGFALRSARRRRSPSPASSPWKPRSSRSQAARSPLARRASRGRRRSSDHASSPPRPPHRRRLPHDGRVRRGDRRRWRRSRSRRWAWREADAAAAVAGAGRDRPDRRLPGVRRAPAHRAAGATSCCW